MTYRSTKTVADTGPTESKRLRPGQEAVPGSPPRLQQRLVSPPKTSSSLQPPRAAPSKKKFVQGWLDTIPSTRSAPKIRRILATSLPRPIMEPWSHPGCYARLEELSPTTPSSQRPYDEMPNEASSFPASSSLSRRGVEAPTYRVLNLADNEISLRPPAHALPENARLVERRIRRDRRPSQGPSPPDEVLRDTALEQMEMDASEEAVKEYFVAKILRDPSAGDDDDLLVVSSHQPMYRHAVPQTSQKYRVSNPVPDRLYGYRLEAFPGRQQQQQLRAMGLDPFGNGENLLYPFLAVEFKGNHTSSGSMVVATNQCLGDGASCVNIMERLRGRLVQKCRHAQAAVDSVAFSVALNGMTAQLYISWKQDGAGYCMRKVGSFLLQDPEHHRRFRRYILNIIDWGRGDRLAQIREALDCLATESEKVAPVAGQKRSRIFSQSAGSPSPKRARKSEGCTQVNGNAQTASTTVT